MADDVDMDGGIPPLLEYSLHDLVKGYRELLAQLEQFSDFLAQQHKAHLVELRSFRRRLKAELTALEKLPARNPTAEGAGHVLRSSNLPFYESVWTTAKLCRGIVSFNKRFNCGGGGSGGGDDDDAPIKRAQRDAKDKPAKEQKRKKGEARRTSVVVDIEADSGAEWIKVSTVAEARILNEMAEMAQKRWAETEGGSDGGGGKDDNDDNINNSDNGREEGNADKEMGDDVEDIDWDSYDGSSGASLLLLAEDLQRAAAAVTRTQYQRPRVQLVLPKLVPGRNGAVDALLARVRRTGTAVVCAPELARACARVSAQVQAQVQVQSQLLEPALLQRMAPDEFARFSPTLNIDCTILLALVSDLSHSPVALLGDGGGGGGGDGGDGLVGGGGGGMGGGGADNKGGDGGEGAGGAARGDQSGPASMHAALRRQIERERTENLVPRVLWPAMAGRALVCTAAAARRMHEIVDTIGTATEKARTAIMMGVGNPALPSHFSPSGDPHDGHVDAAAAAAAAAAAYNLQVGGGGGEDVQMGDCPSISPSDAQSLLHQSAPPTTATAEATATATATALFQQYSVHAVPASWKIPIAVVADFDPAAAVAVAAPPSPPSHSRRGALPPIAARVRERLSPLNQSVFLFGWHAGHTTLTSNRVAAKVIKDVILGQHGDAGADVGVDAGVDGAVAAGGGVTRRERDGALGRGVVGDVSGAISSSSRRRRDSSISISSSDSSIDIIVEGDHRHNATNDYYYNEHYDDHPDEDFGTRMALDTHAPLSSSSSSSSSGPAPYPHIWLCLSARSLLGKEKSRR